MPPVISAYLCSVCVDSSYTTMTFAERVAFVFLYPAVGLTA